MRRICSLILLFIAAPLFGQKLDEQQAARAFEDGAYEEAAAFYRKRSKEGALEKARYRFGVAAIHLSSLRSKGMEVLKGLLEEGKEEAGFWIGIGHLLAGRSEEAILRFHAYRKSGNEKIPGSELERRIQMAVRQKVFRGEKVHLRRRRSSFPGDRTAFRAYMGPSGKRIIFQEKGDLGGPKGDLFRVERKKGGMEIRDRLTLDGSMHLAGISSDGDAVVLRKPQKDAPWNGDLYVAKRKEGEWSEPQKLGATVNTSADERSAWIDRRGRLMVFSSAREGGAGGLDLYIVKKLPTGDWAKAKSMSPAINTPYDEDAPCLMPDERTLYFCSEGHQSMGGKDIFRSYFEEGAKRWVTPENPGFPVNSPDDEEAVSLTREGGKALITRSSSEEPFRFTEDLTLLYDDSHLQVLKGKVKSKSDGRPLKAKLRVFDPSDRSVQGIYRTRSDDGSFVLALRPDKSLEVIVEAEGHVPKVRKVSASMDGLEVVLEEE